MRRSHEEVLDEILFARSRADAAFTSARLVPIDIHRSALHVAGVADRDGHFFVFDQVFQLDLFNAVHDLRAAIIAVKFHHLPQFDHDDVAEFLLAPKNFAQFGDALADLGEFLQDFVNGELRQPVELQLEDGVDLYEAEADGLASRSGERVFFCVELDAANRRFSCADEHAHGSVFEEVE